MERYTDTRNRRAFAGVPARTAILAALAAAFMALGSCEVATNLDIRETAFPSEQSIDLVYKTELKVYGETIGLPDVLDAESSWQIFTVYNGEQAEEITLGDVALEDGTGFTLDTSTLQSALAPLGSSEFRIKYLPPAPGVVETRLFIPYSIAGRDRSFMVVLQGRRNEDTMPIVAVVDPDGAELGSDGVAYDFGYAAATTVSRTFTIRNDGQETLRIYGVYSSDDAAFKVTDKPAVNTALAQGAAATFTVAFQAASMESFSTAEVTVSTNATSDSEFIVNLAGGGSALPVTFAGDVGHLLDGHGYDFGWAAAAETESIALTNSGEIPFTLAIGDVAVSPSDRYAALSIGTETLAAGQSTSLSVRYTPEADEWSEADLTLTSAKGRSYSIRLTGSGFRQPSNVDDLSLWLRADRIRAEHVTEFEGAYLVNTLPDSGGRSIHAVKEYSASRPIFSAAGLNGQPSIAFDGYDDALVASAGVDAYITDVTASGGTTTFVAFKTGAAPFNNRYLLWPSYTSGFNYGFPRVYIQAWNWDPTDGATPWSNAGTRFYMYGYNTTGYANDCRNWNVTAETAYAWAFQVNFAVASPTTNMYSWSNGSQKTVAGIDTYGNPTAAVMNLATTSFYNSRMRQLSVGYFPGSTYSTTFKGSVAEVIVFSRALTTQEVGYVNDYLLNKYGITP